MKKRSALTIAGMLVAALLAGAVSMSLGTARGDVTPTGSTAPVEPRVRTVERTITIHKKAKSDAPAVVKTIPAPAAPATSNAVAASAPSAPAAYEDDDAYEDDGAYEDDDQVDGYGDEGDEYEDEGEDD